MTTLSKPEFKKTKGSTPDVNARSSRIANPIDLSSDPNYTKLLEHYQHAEFTKCKEVLGELAKRHPEHPGLLEFKDDLQMKLSLKDMATSIKEEKKSKKKKVVFNLGIFAVIGFLVVMIVFLFYYYYLNNNVAVKQMEDDTAMLTSTSCRDY